MTNTTKTPFKTKLEEFVKVKERYDILLNELGQAIITEAENINKEHGEIFYLDVEDLRAAPHIQSISFPYGNNFMKNPHFMLEENSHLTWASMKFVMDYRDGGYTGFIALDKKFLDRLMEIEI